MPSLHGDFVVLSTRLHGLLADLSTCAKPQGGFCRDKLGAEYSGNYSGWRRGGLFAARHAPELGCTKLVLTSSNTRNGNGPAFYLAVGIPSNHLGHCFDVDHLRDIPLENAKPRIRHTFGASISTRTPQSQVDVAERLSAVAVFCTMGNGDCVRSAGRRRMENCGTGKKTAEQKR